MVILVLSVLHAFQLVLAFEFTLSAIRSISTGFGSSDLLLHTSVVDAQNPRLQVSSCPSHVLSHDGVTKRCAEPKTGLVSLGERREEVPVAERPPQMFVFCEVLGWGRRRAWVSCGWAEAGSNRKIPGFRYHDLPMGGPIVGRSVMTGWLLKSAKRFWHS